MLRIVLAHSRSRVNVPLCLVRARTIKRAGLAVVLCLTGLTTSGCLAPPTMNGPERLFSPKIENTELQTLFFNTGKAWKKYLLAEPQDRQAFRNEITAARMYAIDVNYTEFEHALNVEGQSLEFWAKLSSATLTTVATAVPVDQTIRGLNAIAHGVDLGNSAYSDAFFRKQLIQNLIASMRAARHEVRGIIRSRMACDSGIYPLGLALSDIEAYYRAGTVETGIMRLTRTATADEHKEKAKDQTSGPTASPEAKAAQKKADDAAVTADNSKATASVVCKYRSQLASLPEDNDEVLLQLSPTALASRNQKLAR